MAPSSLKHFSRNPKVFFLTQIQQQSTDFHTVFQIRLIPSQMAPILAVKRNRILAPQASHLLTTQLRSPTMVMP